VTPPRPSGGAGNHAANVFLLALLRMFCDWGKRIFLTIHSGL
jgi:hypothetical protein